MLPNKTQQPTKLWGGAFATLPTAHVVAFTAGRDMTAIPPADANLLPYDVWLNQAHVLMLAQQQLIPQSVVHDLCKGLLQLEKAIADHSFVLDAQLEDVHTNVEDWLQKNVGDSAHYLHTAKSRNDQSVTDMHLWLRDQLLQFLQGNLVLVATLLGLAQRDMKLAMPGFTHHQHAMVTTLCHWWLGLVNMLLRDNQRCQQWWDLYNWSPLGNMVAYGTSLNIDRAYTAQLLGFNGPDQNSGDAITNRGEAEAALGFAFSLAMQHYSLLAQTLIVWSTPEFGFITVSEEYSTGSSVMPQKKNPDPLEVIKGKTGYVEGLLAALLSIGKNSFLGYNRDSQWTKYAVMDLVREVLPVPNILSELLPQLKVHAEIMEAWAHKGMLDATFIQEQLIQEFHIPMRQAKQLIEETVKLSLSADQLSLTDFKFVLAQHQLSINVTEKQWQQWHDLDFVFSQQSSLGGPGWLAQVESRKEMQQQLKTQQSWWQEKSDQIERAHHATHKAIESGISAL